jgi:hypothetical protein
MTRWVHGVSRDILRAAFREYFGVSEEHIDILVVLYGRPGEWTQLRRLQVLLDSHRPPKRQAVYERVRVLREAMESESLLSGGQLDDQGYALSEVGFSECAKALRALVDALLRSGPKISVPAMGDLAPYSPLSPLSPGFEELQTAVDRLEEERPPAFSAPLRKTVRAAS